ncbi:MAG: T9SS type A sorting domain-containing protein [Bacteroidetes bacterium]|nr:T9SS type A sorting domain-containing protein [Bacteroidota bacterium]
MSTAQQAVDTNIDRDDSDQKDRASFFADFSCAIKNANNVELLWKIANSIDGDYFIVERSVDGSRYETVSALKITDTSTGYGATDNSPMNGTDFYRIKYIGKSGRIIYSKIMQVTLSADVDFKFYPNPVDKLLIIRTSHNIDIQILDPLGTTRLSKQLQPGLQVVNISALEKGSYVLKIADKESNKVVSEQLLKN